MREAYLVGAGQSEFGAFPEESYRSLFADAVDAALDSAPGVAADDVDEATVGHLGVGGRQIGLAGPAVTEHAGLHGVPCTRVENACAASGYAVRSAVQAVRSGMADLALAGGVEVMNDLPDDRLPYWLGVSGETEYERTAGTTFAGVYAQMESARRAEYGTDPEALSRVAVKNHRHGARNPKAHLGFECSFDDAESAPTVAAPLTLYHCCPTTDGAAAVLVAGPDTAETVRRAGADPVRVAGVGAASDAVGLFDRGTLTAVPASGAAADRAYDAAGVADPRGDLDFAEVHDCFSVAELMAYEDLDLCDPGEGGDLVTDGTTALGGELPVNTSGGLKSKGHPIGATGAGQLVEAVAQLRGEAGDRQVPDARRGLTHNVGGSGGAAVVHVLERAEGAVV